MTAARILATAATIAAVLAVSTSPAAAQQAPGTRTAPGTETAAQGSAPLPAAPVLGSGFALEGRWLIPGAASLNWNDVAAASGYELMYRGAGGWVLLSEHESRGGVVVAFDGSSARVGGLPEDADQWWFALRARNALGVSRWSQSAAVRAPERIEQTPLFDPFTAPTRSGIDLERLRAAVATITPGDADCAAAPPLNVAEVTVVDPPASLDDPDAELTVAEVTRIAGGCLMVEYVALAGRTVAQVRNLLAADPSVHAVGEPVRGVNVDDNTGAHTHTGGHHNDSGRNNQEQWHLPQPTMDRLWGGWQSANPVVVAVLDTGVDTAHPDLDGNVAASSLGGCHTTDDHGHGTRIAGIIAAELGGGHVAGVAPKAKILPLRIHRLGLGQDDTECTNASQRLTPMRPPAAIAAAVNAGTRMINMSFRWRRERERTEVGGVPIEPGEVGRDTFELALRAASMLGVVAVASAGNCGDNNDRRRDGVTMKGWEWNDCPSHNAEQRPAVYDDVIAVAGIKSDGDRTDSSTVNAHVDVAAPGDEIRTTQAFRTTEPSCSVTHCVGMSEGTSAASAYVSGVVAHMLNRHPAATAGQVRTALEATADHPNPVERDDEYGHGIVDPVGAVAGLGGILDRRMPSGEPGAFKSLSSGAAHSCGLHWNGAVRCWGVDSVVDDVPEFAFESLSSPPGSDYVCGVRVIDKVVHCWGDVPSGVAAVVDGRFVQVAAGDSHVCGLRPDGTVVCWGDDSSGQTEVPFGLFGAAPSQQAAKIVAGADHTCAITEPPGGSASVVCWGEDDDGQLPLAVPFAVRDVAAGAAHTCVLGTDRLVRCYGDDADGKLDAPSLEFTALWAGADHTCGISSATAVVCWGDSGDGRLDVPAGRYREVASGGSHNCAIDAFAVVRCWGDNTRGQAPPGARLASLSLTQGGADLVSFDPDVTLYRVVAPSGQATLQAAVPAASRSRICLDAATGDGCVALSISRPATVADGTVIEVRVETLFGLGVPRTYRIEVVEQPRLTALSVRPVGAGPDCTPACAELALSPAFDPEVAEYRVVAPADVSQVTVSYTAAGGTPAVSPEDADAAAAGHQVGVGGSGGFVSVAAGWSHSCGVRADRTLSCWGGNDDGELDAPEGEFSAVSSGAFHSCGLRSDGSVACWGGNIEGEADAASGSFSSVSAGGLHSCGVVTSVVRCWGWNLFGQAEMPLNLFHTVSAGGVHSCGVTRGARVWCWGDNTSGQTNEPSGPHSTVSAGWLFSCALSSGGAVSCWGDNRNGQTDAPGGSFSAVSAGRRHACALGADGAASCWGDNTHGQSDAPGGVFTMVSAGDEHTCGLRPGGTVECWGAAALAPPSSGTVTVTVTNSRPPAVPATYTLTLETAAHQDQPASMSRSTSPGPAARRAEVAGKPLPEPSGTADPPHDDTSRADPDARPPAAAGEPAVTHQRDSQPTRTAAQACTAADPAAAVTIADSVLRAEVERLLAKAADETITAADMATLASLALPAHPGEARVASLAGIEHAVNLQVLDLYGQGASDLAPLRCLNSLTTLNLGGNDITDIAALSSLTGLAALYAYGNDITSIAALSGIASLKTLYLDHNNIADISALSTLTSLTTLGLGSNDITSIAALSQLTGLEALYLFDNDIADAAALSGLTALEVLWIDGNDLTDPYQLSGLDGLSYLDARHNLISDIAPIDALDATVHTEPQRVSTVRVADTSLRAALLAALNKTAQEPLNATEIATIERLERVGPQGDPNPISDLSGLEHATALRELRLRNNAIGDITPISNLTQLTTLDLHTNRLNDLNQLAALESLQWLSLLDNNLTTISNLPALPELQMLFLDFNQITDIEPLAGRASLTRIGLVGNNIGDITPLAGLTNLEWVMLSRNNITDIAPLAGLTNIYYLRLTNNNITDLTPLTSLTRLTNLHLYRNDITDIAPLAGLTNLEFLDLRDNHITSLEPLTGLTNLEQLHLGGNNITDFTPLNDIPNLTIHGRDDQTSPS